jgi:hypothetical protein
MRASHEMLNNGAFPATKCRCQLQNTVSVSFTGHMIAFRLLCCCCFRTRPLLSCLAAVRLAQQPLRSIQHVGAEDSMELGMQSSTQCTIPPTSGWLTQFRDHIRIWLLNRRRHVVSFIAWVVHFLPFDLLHCFLWLLNHKQLCSISAW